MPKRQTTAPMASPDHPPSRTTCGVGRRWLERTARSLPRLSPAFPFRFGGEEGHAYPDGAVFASAAARPASASRSAPSFVSSNDVLITVPPTPLRSLSTL